MKKRSEDKPPPKRQAIQSVESGAEILKALMESDRNMALREVAAVSRMSRSQTHRYLLAYVNAGLVQQDAATARYGLGPLALRLGLAALMRTDAIAAANALMPDLVSRTGSTGLITVWSDRGAVVIRWYDGEVPVVASIHVGSAVPILNSAAGHCFLAFLPPQMTKARLAEELRVTGQRGQAGLKKIEELKAKIRAQGYASISGTMLPGLCALAAPVFNNQGSLVLVLGLVGREGEGLTHDRSYVESLMKTAEQVSETIGYSASSSKT